MSQSPRMTDTPHTPALTVAVCSYRNPQMLRLCLESVIATTVGIDCEVVVADSATQDDTRDMMRTHFPQLMFLPDARNTGFGAMVNKCLAVASGERIFIVNSDTIFEDHTVRDLMAYLDAHPRVGVVAPAQKSFNGEVVNTCFRFYTPMIVLYRRTPLGRLPFARRTLARFEMRDYDRKEPRAVDWVIGSAMMVRRADVAQVGGMDPRFFMYMEDVDWCRRFWERGLAVVYHPRVTMYHYYGKGSAGGFLRSLLLNRLTWVHIASAVKYFLKYAGTPSPRHGAQDGIAG